MTRVLVTIGTRPEIIKLAPVVTELRRRAGFTVEVLFTGQHRELLAPLAQWFGIEPDVAFDGMRAGQSLAGLTARLLDGVDRVLAERAPDLVISQGDTTTVFATALACFYRRVPFAHVEAGLRTSDLYQPFPEEANRRLATPLTRYHFAPTAAARQNLLDEGVPDAQIRVTGNTGVDTLLQLAASPLPFALPDGPMMLMTLHRRENLGSAMGGIIRAVERILVARPEVTLLLPLHPNPAVRRPIQAALGGVANARLVEPIDYPAFVSVMRRATVILTDSGGIQEEAPSLGVPLLVMRDRTERPEGLAAGVAHLVGTDEDTIVTKALELLDDPNARQSMSGLHNPYGDGQAARRIVDFLEREFA